MREAIDFNRKTAYIIFVERMESENIGMSDIQFEWDEEKERKNIRKHGITFNLARRVFDDPYRVEIYDEEHSSEEDRYNTIGMVNEILFVVYTERRNNIRIISARIATPEERSFYYGD